MEREDAYLHVRGDLAVYTTTHQPHFGMSVEKGTKFPNPVSILTLVKRPPSLIVEE
jgi:hypothetical protein